MWSYDMRGFNNDKLGAVGGSIGDGNVREENFAKPKSWRKPRVVRKGVAYNRSQEHGEGYRHASRTAVSFLHMKAEEFNDPHAKMVANLLATNLGFELARRSKVD